VIVSVELDVGPIQLVDETSFRKRAEYITVVYDLDQNKVLWIGDNRRKTTLSAFYTELRVEGCERIESAMMLWGYVRRGWAERAWKGWYAIYFHLAGLDLYPDTLKSTHTNA
jgi:hypothetical protein